jgi:hypothetical protein
MTILQIISPLDWLAHLPKTDRIVRQVNPQFQLNMQEREAIAFVEDEISRTSQVTSAVLSCDAVNVGSTLPTQYLSKDTGAALRLTIEETRFHLCCDRWQSLAHNIYALHLGVRYYRQLAEWGLGTMPLLMAGFRENANHAGVSSSAFAEAEEWQKFLGLGPTATLEDANTLYRLRAKNIGEENPEQLRTLNIAIQQARQALS